MTADVPVTNIAAARRFYSRALGRAPDLTQAESGLEWILHDQPQVALRIVSQSVGVGSARVGIGVDDLRSERERLVTALKVVPEVVVIPGVIALVELQDDDENTLVFWED